METVLSKLPSYPVCLALSAPSHAVCYVPIGAARPSLLDFWNTLTVLMGKILFKLHPDPAWHN